MKKTLLVILIAVAPLCLFAQLPSYLPTEGLVGWWPFNGNANDESGNGLNGLVVDAVLSADRYENSNSSYIFQDVIQCCPYIQTMSNLNFTQNEISGSLWFKPELNYQLGIAGTFFSSNNFIQLQYNGGGLILQIWGNTGYQGFTIPTILNSGSWYHVAFSKDQSGLITIVINNNSYNMGSYNGTLNNTSSSNIIFGRSVSTSWPDPFRGTIDDIAIYNRALTQQEITALYTGVPTDNNDEGNNAAANVPAAIAYQAVARDVQGQPLSDAAVQVKFTLIADSLTGAAEYSETHSLTTNSLGLFTTAFGSGTPETGTFANINWASGSKYLKVELDAGSGFVTMGTQQLLSVPYAMRSNTSAKAGTIENAGLPVYADNAAALAGGLVAGQMYRTPGGVLMIVY